VNVNDVMGKKVAGVPLAVVAGAGAVILLAVSLKMKPSTPAVEDTTAIDAANEDYTGVDNQPFQAIPAVNVGSVTTTSAETNDTWARKAIEWLITVQKAPVSEATNAVMKYLGGEDLTSVEGAYRDQVVKQYGLPPEVPASGVTAPKTVVGVKQGKPPLVHVVKGGPDDTYTELAKLYYASGSGENIDLLQAANSALGGHGPFPPGTRVKIPAWHGAEFYRATSATRTAAAIARKNSISTTQLYNMNDGMKFPVKIGTRVRVA
jgi:hypothetical protein